MRRLNSIKENDKQKNLIEIFVNEIYTFNKAHNIVGRQTKEEIYSLDILDCKSIIQYIPPEKNVLDIGSGAGLPGLLIAILQPRSHVTMSEKIEKKAYFIKKTIHTLKLANVKIINEAITRETKNKKRFDIVTARALAPAKKIIDISEQLLAKNGKYILMKGSKKKIHEEVAQLDNNKYSCNIHKTYIKDKNRHILEITKK